MRFILLATFLSFPTAALDLHFAPSSPEHSDAAADYQAIWAAEGAAIRNALEERACAQFPVSRLAVTVAEAPSYSGDADSPMRLRASYPDPVKRGMLVHELGHWLIPPQVAESFELSVHQALNLLLLQVWEDLWGPKFVRAQVAFESQLSESYQDDWHWALALTHEERRATWRAILEAIGRPTVCSSPPPGMCFVKADLCRPAAAYPGVMRPVRSRS